MPIVNITSLAFGGDGVARTDDGCVVFVPFTAPGDEVEIAITEQKKSFARGQLVRVITPGPGRTTPVCRHFGRCGGCAYQHLTYEAEFAAKQSQLRESLERLGGFRDLPPQIPATPAPEMYGYRNKLQLAPGKPELTDNGYHLTYGYIQTDNETFFTVKECPLVKPEINRCLPKAIHSPWGRQNAKKKPAPDDLTIRADAAGNCHFFFGRAPMNYPWLHESLLGQDVQVPLGSFWQINPPVAEKLLAQVNVWASESRCTTLIDAYCGAGAFSLSLTAPFSERILIESDRQASAAANLNHQNRGLGCFVVSGLAEKALPKQLAKTIPDKTLVILDPPRGGCLPPVLNALVQKRPAGLIYVSCNPTTLARDLRQLCKDGTYAIAEIAMFDMFPRTAHFETAVRMQLGK